MAHASVRSSKKQAPAAGIDTSAKRTGSTECSRQRQGREKAQKQTRVNEAFQEQPCRKQGPASRHCDE